MKHHNTIDELRTRISEGRYEVDPVTVADAIIRHRVSLAAAQGAGLRHADGSRHRRLTSVRRIAHGRSRGGAQAVAA